MDSGLIFTVGVAFGILGALGFILLLIGTDEYATAYFSAYWSRLGGRRARTVEAQESSTQEEKVSRDPISVAEQPCPRASSGSVARGLFIVLALLLSGCAHGGAGGHVSASVGGGVGDVHAGSSRARMKGAPRTGAAFTSTSKPSPTSPRTEDLPRCSFEDPWLPEPCRIEVAPGEWLLVRNAGPEREQKRHSRWWWLLVALVTL